MTIRNVGRETYFRGSALNSISYSALHPRWSSVNVRDKNKHSVQEGVRYLQIGWKHGSVAYSGMIVKRVKVEPCENFTGGGGFISEKYYCALKEYVAIQMRMF